VAMATPSTGLFPTHAAVAGAMEPRGDATAKRRAWLFNPVVDFLGLGGGSLVVMALIAALLPKTPEARATLAAITFFVAHAINNPHFAHSYQIFYRDFARKAFGDTTPPVLRLRYIVAGIAVPAALAIFFAVAIPLGDVRLLGLAGNAMMLLVGWHYAKQGYGMLMVDAAFKRQVFQPAERKALLLNTHVGWVVFWLTANAVLSQRSLWGVSYYMLDVPTELMWAGLAVLALTTLRTAAILARKARREGTLPWNGLIAYTSALYIWLFTFQDPLLLLVVPAFHSLQYLMVVWRYQLNVAHGEARKAPPIRRPASRAWMHLGAFAVVGIVFGFAGFWAVPSILAVTMPYDKAIFGTTLFFFVGWVFINVHHYFLDTVMWRRENAETRTYLFG
jgi:hypothetical protein